MSDFTLERLDLDERDKNIFFLCFLLIMRANYAQNGESHTSKTVQKILSRQIHFSAQAFTVLKIYNFIVG